MNHRMFAFKDLEPGEDIYEVRAGEGSFTMVMGDLQEKVGKYLEQYHSAPSVNEAAGDYYNDLKLRYGDQLDYSYEDLYRLLATHYLKAYEQGAESFKIVSEIGKNSLYLGNLEQGAAFYGIALTLEPRNPSYYYNLGFARTRLSDYGNGIEHLEVAAEYYEDPDLKSDAYGLMGEAYQKQGIFRRQRSATGSRQRYIRRTTTPSQVFSNCYSKQGRKPKRTDSSRGFP